MIVRQYRRAIGTLILLWLVLSASPATDAAGDNAMPAGNWFAYLPLLQNTCAPVRLAQDGGFEAGLPNPVWQTSSNVFSDILDDTPDPTPHSGTWKAWLGGDNLVQESLWQVLSVPAGLAGIQVSYWWRVDTFETTHPFDTLEVQIRDATGTPLQTLETLTDGDAGPTWQQSTFTLTGYAGQTIQLAFAAQTDDTSPTSFFVDDVGVHKTCPSGLTADVTGDCWVNIIDIQEVVAHWGETRGTPCFAQPYDQDGDGIIGMLDIQQVASQWQQAAPGQ
ncbi:MAG: choice-of-anchor J domain-containing protein [Anaerolineae bacterium]